MRIDKIVVIVGETKENNIFINLLKKNVTRNPTFFLIYFFKFVFSRNF